MRGHVLTHRSTRSLKIVEMQEVFETLLPPTQLPLDELLDYDLIRFVFIKMMKAEGLKSLWKTGQDPPASVQEWWGNEDWALCRRDGLNPSSPLSGIFLHEPSSVSLRCREMIVP